MKVSDMLLLPLPTVRPSPSAGLAPVIRWVAELGEAVRTVAWQSDHSGVLVLTASGGLERLDAATGRPTWAHVSAATGFLCLSLCPTAPIVAVGGPDGQLMLRNAYTGRIASVQHLDRGWVERVSWSPDGRLLAATCGQTLHILDTLGHQLASFTHPDSAITSVCWVDDSRALATSSGAAVRLFRMDGASASLRPYQTLISEHPLISLAWNAAGHCLAAGSTDGTLVCWSLATLAITSHKPASRFTRPNEHLSWHVTGRWLASAQAVQVLIWPLASSKLSPPRLRLQQGSAKVCAMAFQHQGDLLASADAAGTLALWHPSLTPAPLFTYSLRNSATCLQWMPNDCCLAVGTETGQVLVVSTVNGK